MSSIKMALAISIKPMNCFSSLNRRKDSKACFVSHRRTAALTISPNYYCSSLKCINATKSVCDDQIIPSTIRRTGNYNPSLWGFDYLQSLSSEYQDEKYLKRASELVEQVKMILLVDEQKMEPIPKLELIDNLHRLGISYHFEEEINRFLNSLYDQHQLYFNGNKNYYHQMDLYSTSLGFRLLRQHGFSVSQDVFDCFKNETGDCFKESIGDNNTKGLLQLYEASFLMTRGENTLELAREFATDLLRKKLDRINEDDDVLLLTAVRHALELPIHWRVERPNARWFIGEAYAKSRDMNPIVLELAKLDFNIVQAKHQQELKYVSSWWEKTSIAKILPFARERVVENYLWTTGMFDPQYGYSRIMATKVIALITVIDDVFDVYGTLEELQIFNEVIQRWDIEAMDKLPHYMQICFLVLNNFVNELAYDVLKQQGILIIPHLRKSWGDLCKAYMQEAEWYYAKYTPTKEEYVENAWISISAPAVVSQAYFIVTNPIDKEAVQSLYKYHNIVRCSSLVFRLANDLGTSSDEMSRGDVPKLIQCYMRETGANIEEARDYAMSLMREAWKKTNEELLRVDINADSQLLPQNVITIAVDLVRMAQYMYQHGDGYGIQNLEMKDRISSLLFDPFLI
ncbi:hypothetical protein ABFS83_01G103400 [Erythranthe nasuta]